MIRFLRLSVALTSFGLLSSTASRVSAQKIEGQERLVLDYRVPQTCPPRSEFVRRVAERTSVARFVDGPEHDRAFAVEIVSSPVGFDGRLSQAGGAERTLSDANCTEVVSALAVVLAVAVDPEAALRELGGESPVSGPLPPAPPPVLAPAPAPASQPPPPPPAPSAPPYGPEAARGDPVRFSGNFGPLFFATAGVAPVALIGVGMGTRIEAEDNSYKLSGGVSVLTARSGLLGPDAEASRYTWFAVRVDACPISLELADQVELSPCVEGDFGFLRGEGVDVAGPRSQTGPWISAGGAALLSWRPVRFIFINGSGYFHANLQRDRFVFQQPFQVVHAVPAVSGGGLVSVGWHFP